MTLFDGVQIPGLFSNDESLAASLAVLSALMVLGAQAGAWSVRGARALWRWRRGRRFMLPEELSVQFDCPPGPVAAECLLALDDPEPIWTAAPLAKESKEGKDSKADASKGRTGDLYCGGTKFQFINDRLVAVWVSGKADVRTYLEGQDLEKVSVSAWNCAEMCEERERATREREAARALRDARVRSDEQRAEKSSAVVGQVGHRLQAEDAQSHADSLRRLLEHMTRQGQGGGEPKNEPKSEPKQSRGAR